MTYSVDEFLGDKIVLFGGDNRDVMKDAADNSIDAILTDPPYALVSIVKRFGGENAKPAKGNDAYTRASSGFMQRTWDTGEVAFSEIFWSECLRVLKPGGHLLSFGGTRTYHRMTCAIEDAGFEIRDSMLDIIASDDAVSQFLDTLNEAQVGAFAKAFEQSQFGGMLAWTYGSGFPKSHDVSKGIDKAAGAVRKVIGSYSKTESHTQAYAGEARTEEWGKANIPITAPATPAAQAWSGFGTALKPAFEPICLARKPLSEKTVAANVLKWGTGAINIDGCRVGDEARHNASASSNEIYGQFKGAENGGRAAVGRFPANVITDGSDEVVAAFPYTKSGTFSGKRNEPKTKGVYGSFELKDEAGHAGSEGSAARFFYQAKANKTDRAGSAHPTVKPIALMRYLARLIAPPGGTILDPFAGSGTTGEAAYLEGFNCYLIEREAEYVKDIAGRFAAL